MKEEQNISKFGEVIKAIRTMQDISLYDVEKAIGISPAYISRLERGDRRNPSIDCVAKISNYYGISIDVIKDCFPGFSEEEEDKLVQLEDVILKQNFIFANEKANINIKLKLIKIINLINVYITSDKAEKDKEAEILQEVDSLRKVIKSA